MHLIGGGLRPPDFSPNFSRADTREKPRSAQSRRSSDFDRLTLRASLLRAFGLPSPPGVQDHFLIYVHRKNGRFAILLAAPGVPT